MVNRAEIEQLYVAGQEEILDQLKKFLSFKSISTDPGYDRDCRDCADWLKNHFESMGMTSELLETGRKPVVYAECEASSTGPTVTFYGHYDVQPVDPVSQWTTDPFSPEIRSGRIYARGAQDNKGQLYYVIRAVQLLKSRGLLGCTVKFFIEGEEECGSVGITRMMSSWREKLASDILLVCDTGTRSADVCAITMGLRGIISTGIKLSGPRTDLHSGVHGGVAPNPALEMVRLLSKLHDAQGKVAIPGFYEGVSERTTEEQKISEQVNITDQMYQQMSGVLPRGGEQGRSFADRRGFRPTIEINGIHSEYGGAGTKTIVPAEAIAKISARLVPGQDPAKILDLITGFLKKNAPDSLNFEVTDREVGGPALRVAVDSAPITRAREVLSELSEQPVELIWEGASIPIVSSMAEIAGAQPLLVGFGLEEDNIHAPDESFSLEQFKKGILFAGMYLSKPI